MVQAINSRGWSIMSASLFGPLMQDVPRQMSAIVKGVSTSNLAIALEWTAPDNGGTPITGYVVMYKFSYETEYYLLVKNYNQLQYQLTNNVVEGASYMFIAKAENSWGLADEWSHPTTILAATTPAQITTVTATYDPATGGIQVSWAAAQARGSAVTTY